MSQSKQSKLQGGIETASEQQSLLNSYKKINAFLGGERDLEVSKVQMNLNATDKKEGSAIKHL